MVRLQKATGTFDLTIDPSGDLPVRLMFDQTRFKPGAFRIATRWQADGDTGRQEWVWQNGPGGAGTTVETPTSYAAGACEYGEYVWLGRRGVAQAAGKLVELPLPPQTAALRSGQFTAGVIFGRDLYLTTLTRWVVKVPNAALTAALEEHDVGAGGQTVGAAIFAGTGTACLYIGDAGGAINVFDGTAWSEGLSGTARGWLEVVNWMAADAISSGGVAGSVGVPADHLVMTDPTGVSFAHVVGDPKDPANWSADIPVGSGGAVFPIARTVASSNTVWFGTGAGVRAVDQIGRAPNLTKTIELNASVNNCAAITYWDGLVWVATEPGLFAFAPNGDRVDVGQFVQFATKTGTTPIFGRPLALAPAPDGLFVGYYNADNQTSYVGRVVKDPDGTYRWSMAEAVIPGQIVTYLQQAVDQDGNPGLFIGTVEVANRQLHLWRQYQPKYGDPESDILHEGPFVPATDWSLRLSRFNGSRPVPKTLRRYTLETEYLGEDYPDNTVDILVSADGGAFEVQGTATSSPTWDGTPSTSYVRATSAQVKLAVHNDPAHPVLIRSVSIDYTPQPPLTKWITYPVRFSEQETNDDPEVVLGALERLLETSPITYVNEFGSVVEGAVEALENQSVTLEDQQFVGHLDLVMSVSSDPPLFDVDVWDGPRGFA